MKYSVVIPVYNSQDSLEELFNQLSKSMEVVSSDYEIIFVDDFSQDESWKILSKIKSSSNDKVKLVRLAKNYGQHNATFCGFKYATGDRVITIDDDLQYSPEDITLLIERMDETEADLVYGVGEANHSLIRNASSNVYKAGVKYLEKKKAEGSSFRLAQKRLLDKIINHEFHFIFLDEIIPWYTDYIEIVPVNHFKRPYGKSNYSFKNTVRLANKNTLNYSDLPLRMMTYGGAVFSFIFFLVGLYFILKKLVFNINVPGFTGLIVAISFSTSLMLLCFGIIGRYMNNILSRLNEKPTYSIKSEVL